mmetsp:Transcript_26632/g.57867  ORF Transcript_26632/g.57867 Transcript_26632/m.57867 type:complete len:459 (-) Transcript_26632:17-1393(-)
MTTLEKSAAASTEPATTAVAATGVTSEVGTEHHDALDDDLEAHSVVSSDSEIDEKEGPGQLNQFQKRGQQQTGGNAAAKDVGIEGEENNKSNELPELSGWVEKTAPSMCWCSAHERFVRISEKQLRWFENDKEDSRVLGHLDMDLIDVEISRHYGPFAAPHRTRSCCLGRKSGGLGELLLGRDTRSAFSICPVGSKRVFEISLPTETEAEAWVSCIELHESRSVKMPNGGETVRKDNWWRSSRISPERFEQVTATGDVLLFRSKGSMPKLIRLASGSKGRYDHVGLIVKLSGGEVGILEATGGEGVGLVTWKEFVDNNWQDLYPELALRRVFFHRSKERCKKLQEWVNETLGKPYDLTVSKLMARTSAPTPVGEENYFCSQLCAKGLKVLGVLPEDGMASTQYWPSTFSARMAPIKCNEGCRFDQADLVIDFSLGDPKRYVKKEGGGGKQRDATTNWG